MKRDWTEFNKYLARSLRFSVLSLTFVPVISFLMNPNFGRANFLSESLLSIRVGAEITLFYLLVMNSIYAMIYQTRPEVFLRLKHSIPFRVAFGGLILVLALSLTSRLEATVFGLSLGLRFMTTGLLIGLIIMATGIAYFEFKQSREQLLKMRAEGAEAKLAVLRNQMQPHFLFNTLNSILELVDSRDENASAMLQNLSDFYREILEASKSPTTSLGRELSILKRYLELEKMRFCERLKYVILCPEDLMPLEVPSLILQTLAENSLKHGLAHLPEGGLVEIKVTSLEDGASITITNPMKAGMKSTGTGTGVLNTRMRLELLYPGRHGFQANSNDGNFRVSFTIPRSHV